MTGCSSNSRAALAGSARDPAVRTGHTLAFMQLTAANLPVYALGCAIASSGGGGATKIPLAIALRAVSALGPVDIVAVDELPPDGVVMPVGMVGSPVVATERIWSGDEAFILREQVEALSEAPVVAVMCFEIAGSNGLLPVTWAARLGLPLLDADGMGRAFPEMQQQAMHLAGVSASPMVLTDGCGDVSVHRRAGVSVASVPSHRDLCARGPGN